MGEYRKVIQVGMDYSQASSGIADINRKMRLLESEFKLAGETMKNYASETTKVELNIQRLSEKIVLQEQKVKFSEDAYKNAVATGQASQKQLERLYQTYITNQTGLARLNNELAQSREKLDASSNATQEQTNTFTELDSKIKLLEAQYKLATEQIKTHQDKSEKLRLTSQHLTEKIELQSRKTNELEQAYRKATESGEYTESQLNNLKREYIENETALERMNRELNDTERELRETAEEAGNTGSSLNSTAGSAVEFGAKLDIAREALSKLKDGMMLFLDFDSAMSRVKTIADTTVVSFEDLTQGTKDIANDVKMGYEDIANAMYNCLSANVATEDALEATRASAILAKTGYTDTATAVDVLTTILNGYNMKVQDSVNISDKLVMTQKLGKTTVDEIGKSFGKVAGLANTAGVSLDELLTVIATGTQVSGNASETITGLKAVLSNIVKPTKEAEEAAKKLGIRFSATSIQSMGLANFLELVKRRTQGNADTMATLFGSTEALNLILQLTGSSSESFAKNLEEISNAGGTTDEALKNLGGTGNDFKDSVQLLENKLTDLGEAAIPLIDLLIGIMNTLSSIPTPIYVILGVIGGLIIAMSKLTKIKTAEAVINGLLSTTTNTLGISIQFTATSFMRLFIVIAAVVAIIGLIIGVTGALDKAMSSSAKAADQMVESMNGIESKQVEMKQGFTLTQYHAFGTDNFRGGRTYINEGGVEEVILPTGSRIIPAEKIKGDNSGNTYIFHIDAKNVKEFNQLVEMADRKRMAVRRGV